LRQPSDLAFQGNDLYVVDSARDDLFDTPDLDELDLIEMHRVEVGAHFGFPYCIGANVPDMPSMDCATATPPLIAFPTASTPLGIAAYRGAAIPMLQGKLLVVLGGSYNDISLRGYWIAVVDPVTRAVESLMPTRPDINPAGDFTLEEMNLRGSGFFPHRPLDVAVTEQGVVYVSVGGGRILVMRQ
jgi:glucose/arabinose dehydrogenase